MVANINYERLFSDLPAPYMMLDSDLRFIAANRQYLAATNSKLEDLLGEYIFDAFPETEERMAVFKSAFEKAVAGEANSVIREHYVLADSDAVSGSREVWWTTHQFPLFDDEGNIIGMGQKAEDVTINVEAERTRDVVLREFDHRMNNMLAKVSAIARRTGETYPNMVDFMPEYEARIGAMAKTQNLLMRTQWEDVDLHDLADNEFAPYRDSEDDRISVSGPDVRIKGDVAQAIGMAFHELATNAAKYGGLAVPDGKVELSWHKMDQPAALVIEWSELGLTQTSKMPSSTGFGSLIIDKFTPMETGGTVDRHFENGAMRCTITIPETNS